MKIKRLSSLLLVIILCALVSISCDPKKPAESTSETATVVADPLPSWNDGPTKDAIINYVEDVTTEGSTNFIKPNDRIATFDNDGTLWSEQPAYFQLFFAMDRVKAMAGDHPEWKNEQPFKAILENDMPALMKEGMGGLMKIIMTTHAGMTIEEFDQEVMAWVNNARHPVKDKAYTDLVYQPMLELISYLTEKDFKVFIVSGGGIEFMRPWAENVYGIPKERIVGSSLKSKFEWNDGNPVIRKLAEVDLIDDKEGKPVGINRYIGRKPVFSAGNSDGDLQMLQWANSNTLKNFQLFVHHTDSLREWAYDRNSHIGALDKGLDIAKEKGWTLIDMKNDWKVIYPFELVGK